MSPVQQTLRSTAALLQSLRSYFAASGALEVVTPVLSASGTTDPDIHSLSTLIQGAGRQYLQTSPEFAMKRLLAAGSGDIYQICKVFRDDESGRLHRPEFLMCEWYRLGWDHQRLMQEVDSLLQQLWREFNPDAGDALPDSRFISYTDAIESVCAVPLASLDSAQIQHCLQRHSIESPLDLADPLDDWLDLLLGVLVFPGFAEDRFTFMYDYPASQAALARTTVNARGEPVACRFEVFYGAIELGNGFYELSCAREQRQRFEQELRQREIAGLPSIPVDQQFLAALAEGLPECAGVAVGLERLLMVLQGTQWISDLAGLEMAHD